jgi:hypothetical protein
MFHKLKTAILLGLLSISYKVLAQNIQVSSSLGYGIETGGKMTQDANGNIYCFGIFTDTMRLSNTLFATSSGNFDCYIAKFNKYMQPQWIKTIGGAGAEGAGAISYFGGKLFLGGWYGAQTIINNDTLDFNFNCIAPGFIASMDTSGNFIKAKDFITPNSVNLGINALEVNQTGLVIAGGVKGQFDFGNNQYIATVLTGTQNDIFVARMDTAFNCSFALKAGSTAGAQNGDDGAQTLQIDTLGNIYIAGFFGNMPNLNNGTLFFGGQTLTATGSYGFNDFFIAKIRPNGAVAWLRGSGGQTPDFIFKICLENNSRIALAGRYADNANVGGIPLPPSPGDYSSFVGAIDSAGTGISAFRVSNESVFYGLEKGENNYIYAADYNSTSPISRFKIYKINTDTGVIAIDSITISNNVSSYMNGDILFSGLTCDEIILNSSYKSVVKYGNDTLLNFAVSNYNENLLYGKYSLNNSLIAQPQIITPSNPVFCSNSDDITLTVPPLSSASTYHWQLFPANAGQIISNGNSILLNVDSNFAGQIKIVCYASNFCNVSTLSDTLTLTINQAPIIYSIDDTGFGAVTSNVVNATSFNWYLDNVLLNFANMPTVNCIADGIYSIIATNGTCDDTLASFVSCIVSDVDEISTTGVNIYPNPVQENITIEIDPSETIKAVTIYDVSGKLLIQSTAVTNKIILNISELSFGYYFVKVQSSLSHYVSKIVID